MQTATATVETRYADLHEAVCVLAGRCNYARTHDGAGFSKFDAEFGHKMAEVGPDRWSPKAARGVWKMLRKYRGQLAGAGIDYEALTVPPEPVEPKSEEATVTRTKDGRQLAVCFPYSPALIQKVKTITGARWNPTDRAWMVPVEAAARLAEFGFTVDAAIVSAAPAAPVAPFRARSVGDRIWLTFPFDEVVIAQCRRIPGAYFDREDRAWVLPHTLSTFDALPQILGLRAWDVDPSVAAAEAAFRAQYAEAAAEAEALIADSKATDAEIALPTMGVEPRPFQRAGIAYALKRKRTFLADEPGLGKTIQAIGTVMAAEAYPVVAVVPASLKLNWQREIKRADPSRSIEILSGTSERSPLLPLADWTIVNYDILHAHADALRARGIKTVIFDESHLVKNKQARRSKAAKAIAKDVEYRLFLTGTPILNRPSELASQLDAMGRLDDFGGFWNFARRYCGAERTRFGLDLSGALNLDELHIKLRATCFIRRLKAEVLTELPAKIKADVPVTLSNAAEYAQVEDDLIQWLRAQVEQDRQFRAEIAALPAEEQAQAIAARQDAKEDAARRAETLVRINALKRVCARGKLDTVFEWVENFLDSGEKIVLFGWHHDVISAIADRFNAPKITGEQTIEERQAAVDRFQTDPTCRVIVLNMRAGGVGITLTAASNVAFVELPWTPGDLQQAEDRTHRIGQQFQVTAWYLTAPGTIEDWFDEILESKRKVSAAALDGVQVEESESVLDAVVERLLAK